MKVDIKIEGMEELDKKSREFAGRVDHKKLEPILLNLAKDVAENIRAKAPRGPTGNLKRSPIAKLMPSSKVPIAIAAINRKIAPHAHLVEFGTVKMRPHPFFRPAWDEKREGVHKGIVEFIKKELEK